jgi:hypothetical protein
LTPFEWYTCVDARLPLEPLIRYSTLRRQQCLKIGYAGIRKQRNVTHNLGPQFIGSRILLERYRIARSAASFTALKRACRYGATSAARAVACL